MAVTVSNRALIAKKEALATRRSDSHESEWRMILTGLVLYVILRVK